MSLADLRKQLRELRKEVSKPVSRMRKDDVAREIERLSNKRETTPPVASVPGPSMKPYKAAVENIKKAKEAEFPVKPSKAAMKEARPEKKKISKSALRQMLDELTSDEE